MQGNQEDHGKIRRGITGGYLLGKVRSEGGHGLQGRING